MATKNYITSGDTVFARISKGNTPILNLELSGFRSATEIVRHLMVRLASAVSGLVTVDLRNANRGWTSQHRLNIAVQ